MLWRHMLDHLLFDPEDGGNISLPTFGKTYKTANTYAVTQNQEDSMNSNCCENLNSYVRYKNFISHVSLLKQIPGRSPGTKKKKKNLGVALLCPG